MILYYYFIIIYRLKCIFDTILLLCNYNYNSTMQIIPNKFLSGFLNFLNIEKIYKYKNIVIFHWILYTIWGNTSFKHNYVFPFFIYNQILF